MTYGEKFEEVFGYYPDMMPCPKECPQGRQKYKFCNEGSECEYFADFREKEYVDPEEQEYLDQEDKVDTSPEHLSDVDRKGVSKCIM